MQINVAYDASVSPTNFSGGAAEEAQFKNAISYVVNLYDNLFVNDVTVNINVGWGEAGGNALNQQSQVSAHSDANFFRTDYATVLQALTSTAQSSVQKQADATLPTVDQSPFGTGDSIGLTTANAKALGLVDPNGTATDGSVGFNSSCAWSFDPNSTPTGDNDFIATAEHEISEVLGRLASVGELHSGQAVWRPTDLFRYTAAGQRDLSVGGSGSSAYFSIDNGSTSLGAWNNDGTNGKDLGDWLSNNGIGSGPGPDGDDAFDGYSGTGHANPLTMSDLALMNVIGWNTAQDPATTVPNGVVDWVASGHSRYGMTVLSGGEQEGHELMFKLGMARSVLVHGDATPERAEQLWQEDKARRRATLARMAPPPRPKP
jgi:hypothetical protein